MCKTLIALIAVLVCAGLPLAAEDGANLLENPSFEELADGKPAAWLIGDSISSVSTDQAHTGKHSLKIVDPDEKTGSSVHSSTFQVERGKMYVLWLWAYLEAGKSGGLGAYFDLLDSKGKRMKKQSEASSRPVPMIQGKWTRFRLEVVPSKQATSLRVWLHTYSNAVVTCYVDDLEVRAVDPRHFGPAIAWKGGSLDEDIHKKWPYGLRWVHGQSASVRIDFDQPQDWTKYNAIRFGLYLPKATQSTCMVIIASENLTTPGMDYYSTKLRLDWTGWKEIVLPFRELGAARKPVGWHFIKSVYFTASGWGQTVVPETVAVLDGFEPVTAKQTGQRMTDDGLFHALDLSLPAIEGVKVAYQSGNLEAAKAALARHIRERTYPRWLYHWRDRPLAGDKVPGPEADKAPDQWDYYSTYIKLDWQGWKRFQFRKADLEPRGYVEGKGWKGKKPIGWHWIQYVMLSARGWGLTPDPQVVLHFDDVKLVGKGKSVCLSDFDAGESSAAGLAVSTAQAHSGSASGRWECLDTTAKVQWSDIPHDWTEFDTLEMWIHLNRPSKSRVVVVLDSDVPRAVSGAQRAMDREWSYTQGPGKRGTLRFGSTIDWAANPTEGEARTHLWNESLNRHFHFRSLARAYWGTGQDRYAKEIADQLTDWVESNPPPLLSSGNRAPRGCYAWQTLTTGIRLADTWPEALYRCGGSPAFTDEVLCTMLKSIRQQANHLVRWPSRGNWLTAESNGLYTAGMLFPEFKEAKQWRATAIERIYRQFDDEVYPDGMEYELAAGYNNWVVREFAHIFEIATLNGLAHELPDDYTAKIEKCYNYQLYACMPNGCIPGLNDSGNSAVRGSLASAHELFPHRADFLYVGTNGVQGRKPEHTSHAFPWTGHYVMRSGWDSDATFLLLDAGPFGSGHQHEDKLHFVLYSHGRQLVLDPGNFSYDRSRWRRYVLSTSGHNTVMVDGQNQARRSKRDTYYWPRPWTGPAPETLDAAWASTPEYDFAAGVYRDGYGPGRKLNVEHRRCVLWVKPTYFLIVDVLAPRDNEEHTYDVLFHLDTADAAVEGLAARSLNEGQANVEIAAVPDTALSLRTVKGKTDEPVQGWANGPWRAIPTAIYTKKAKGLARMAFVVTPWASEAKCPVVRVQAKPLAGPGIAGQVCLANGETHDFIFPDEPGTLGVASHARVQVLSKAGRVLRTINVEAPLRP